MPHHRSSDDDDADPSPRKSSNGSSTQRGSESVDDDQFLRREKHGWRRSYPYPEVGRGSGGSSDRSEERRRRRRDHHRGYLDREERYLDREERHRRSGRHDRDGHGGYSERRERRRPPSSPPLVLPSDGEDVERMISKVQRRKDFVHMDRVDGRDVNVLEGLELHTGVFSAADQKQIVDCVYDMQDRGRRGMLREKTYSEPRRWMRGKGRITIQFGCCYNYARDKRGNPPGIIRDEEVDPMPPLLKAMIKRMVEWDVLPATCIPDSCIINIYDRDDCIPPHIDHHDFLRPFCTVSFLTECDILFGRELRVLGPGDFSGSSAITLPLGSVLVLSGNGADVAKHCVPAVPSKRISITFRKMDDKKLPYKFAPDPYLQNLRAVAYPPPPRRSRHHGLVMQQEENSESAQSGSRNRHREEDEDKSPVNVGEGRRRSIFSRLSEAPLPDT